MLKTKTKLFIYNLILGLFLLYVLSTFFGFEFNTNPHIKITITNCDENATYRTMFSTYGYTFCPKWVFDDWSTTLSEIDIDYTDESYCSITTHKWINPRENRVIIMHIIKIPNEMDILSELKRNFSSGIEIQIKVLPRLRSREKKYD